MIRVFIAPPGSASTASGAVSISVDASDNVGVAGVTIAVDGVGIGSYITPVFCRDGALQGGLLCG